MTREAATPDTQPAKPVGDGPTTGAKRRQSSIVKFPLRFHCAITSAMGDSLRRLTGSNSLLAEADIGRLALHSYLTANDPQYVRAMNNGGRNA
jgi:hypothetical protein